MSDVSAPLYRKGIVALSADPITYGHLDLIRRAKENCKEMVVLVANNDSKAGAYRFSLEERVAMTQRAVSEAEIPNTKVVGSGGLLVDVYLYQGCDMLFRGVRNAKDLEYEDEQAELNRMILPEVQIEYLQAKRELHLVSSSMVKAFVLRQLDVHKFVPMFVQQALQERLLGQYRIGITGPIAVGKSWVATELVKHAKSVLGEEWATSINVDQMLRDVYDEDSPGAQLIRDRLADKFGADILLIGGRRINRKRLAEILFVPGAEGALLYVTELTKPHVARKYREALANAKGLVVMEWAQTAEMAMGSWTNHNVIAVDSTDRPAFLEERGIDEARQATLKKIQWPASKKARVLNMAALEARSGQIFTYDNLRRLHPEESQHDIAELFSSIMKQMFPDFVRKE